MTDLSFAEIFPANARGERYMGWSNLRGWYQTRPTLRAIAAPFLALAVIGRWLAVLITVLTTIFALAGCGYQHETFRYRLTIEVDTPQGLRRGSSVIEVSMSQTGDGALTLPEASGVRLKMRGEAVTVEMPDGQLLFALLRSKDDIDAAKLWPFQIEANPGFKGEYAGIRNARHMEEQRARGELPRHVGSGHYRRSIWPMLVTFGDLSDPTSVEEVDPDNLAETFGEGITLRRITVEMTDDPVTTGIEQRLRWLSDPSVMENPGWGQIPIEARRKIIGLHSGQTGTIE
ncbi:hypothetical protein [Croceicoccus sp. Ery5]|uniref:hypothetical protein n=1 Tax=Croceicoccus sp. Ery5 TaxID=1703340 RepID=UPI001E438D4A|nr:hypothetical protein [Croceicoccus sp. Ery5]